MQLHASRVGELYYSRGLEVAMDSLQRLQLMQQDKSMVCCLLQCYQFLQSLLMPASYLRSEATLVSNITDNFVERSASLLVTGLPEPLYSPFWLRSSVNFLHTEAGRLYEREDWIALDGNSGTRTVTPIADQSDVRITSLPREFKDLVMATLKLLQGVSHDPSNVRCSLP